MMSIARSALIAAGAGLSLVGAHVTHAADSPLGVWLDDSGRGAVEIVECGGKLCGKLVWLKDSADAKACGTAIIGEVAKVGDSWDGGWIYSPEKKAKYDVELTPDGRDKLTVLGYLGTKLFSQEMTWTRAPADLKRCDVQEAKAAAPPAARSPDVTATAPAGQAAAATSKATDADGSPPASASGAGAAEAVQEPTRTQTAQAEPPPAAKRSEKATPRKTTRRKMCRVDAPFVRVEFPCDDD